MLSLTLGAQEYTLAADIAAAAEHYSAPPGIFKSAPLVVLNNFVGEKHLRLAAVVCQNMFPVRRRSHSPPLYSNTTRPRAERFSFGATRQPSFIAFVFPHIAHKPHTHTRSDKLYLVSPHVLSTHPWRTRPDTLRTATDNCHQPAAPR
jgi:hypothetical protein